MPTKSAVLAAFRALLQSRRAALLSESTSARAGARVDGVHRPASRGERGAVSAQGALAHGLSARAGALADTLALLDEVDLSVTHRVRAGALVEIAFEDDTSEEWMLLPGGAGDRVEGVLVLSPAAPAARLLLGREEGDEVVLRRGGVQVEAGIARVT